MSTASIARSLRRRRVSSARRRARRSYALRRLGGSRSAVGRMVRWFAFPLFPVDLRGLAGLSALAVFAFAYWWGHTMDVTGSAIDAYPSMWLASPGFRGTVVAGAVAGSCLWASLLPWRPMRFAGAISLTVTTLALFLSSLGTGIWFEMNLGLDLPSPLFVDAVHLAVVIAVLGWLLALAVVCKRLAVTSVVGAASVVRAVLR